MTQLAAEAPGHPTYRWHACDLKTGRRLETFPFRGTPEKLIGSAVPVSLTCDLADDAADGKDFWGTILPRRTMIALERIYPGEATSDIPWVGVVTSMPERGPDPLVAVGTSTIEAYLDRRYVGTHTFTGQPGDTDAAVLTALMGDANTDGINIALDLADLTTLRDVRYKEPDFRTVLSCLQELSDLDGGPEWTIRAAWSGSNVALTLVARPRLGVASTQSSPPFTQFRWPGSVLTYNAPTDHTSEHGGNHYTAYATGAGGSKPKATASNAADIAVAGRWEVAKERPGTRSITELQAAANAGLLRVIDGQSVITLEADSTTAPQVGRDWVEGDDIRLIVQPWNPADPALPRSYGHPDGLDITARAIGWALDIDASRIRPRLWLPGDDEETGVSTP